MNSIEFNLLGEDIFKTYRRGEMTKTEYDAANAMMIEQNISRWRPHFFPEPPASVTSYTRNRFEKRCEYSQDSAIEINEWRLIIFRLREENNLNEKTILWAIEKLTELGMENKTVACKAMLEEYKRQKFPSETYAKVLAVLEMDAFEKLRK